MHAWPFRNAVAAERYGALLQRVPSGSSGDRMGSRWRLSTDTPGPASSCCSQRTCMFTNEISMLQECCCQHPGNARGDHSPPARIVLGASVPLKLYATCQCVRDGANGRRREGRLGPQGNGGQACDARDCDELRSNNPCGCGPPHRWHQRGRE